MRPSGVTVGPTEVLEAPPRRGLWPWLLVGTILTVAAIAAVLVATSDTGSSASSQTTVVTPTAATATAPAPSPPPPAARRVAAPSPVPVPDLSGQKLDDALAALGAAGLRAQVVAVPAHGPKDRVIDQRPAAGAQT